jgi:hypothetical protein
MTGQTIEQLVANQWVERLDADDAEVLGFWHRAIESYDDAATPRLSRTGQFKLLYDAARQGVVALNAAHGYRAKGAANHHEHTFAAGTVLAPEALTGSIAAMQTERGVRRDLEYGAHRTVTEAKVGEMRDSVCALLNGLADEIRRLRPALKQPIRKLRCSR